MIRIEKPADPPAVLAGRGAEETARNRDRFDADPDHFRDGTETFDFRSDLYGHDSVKDALRASQHDKCCFCESKFAHVSYGDVEHFRPKAAVRQSADGPLERPGYYWLAYEWSNLFASCQICNQRFKKNLFPLDNPRGRARSHHDDLGREKPLLLDPGRDEPGRAIGFREEVPYAIRNSRRARATIEAMGLDRPEMGEARRSILVFLELLVGNLKLLRRALRRAPPDERAPLLGQIALIEAELRRSTKPTAAYSSMAATYIKAQLGSSFLSADEH